MSYARIGKDSAVYVIDTGGYYQCISCHLLPKCHWFDSYRTTSLAELRSHLEEHDAVGHRIPRHTWQRIDRELREGA
jgi:hypothetical protein